MPTFSDLGINLRLIAALKQSGITTPTEIQCRAIPAVMTLESDLMILSQTGSGKSLSYLLPIIDHGEHCRSRTLILLPTRELAGQLSTICHHLCEQTHLRVAAIYGGVDYEPQREALRHSPDIIIATPGRLMDLISRGEAHIDSIDRLILDEADQMVDMGFHEAITSLAALRNASAHTIAISATMPEKLREILATIAPEMCEVKIESERVAIERIAQSGYYVERAMMDPLLLHLLRRETIERAIIFTRSRMMAERVTALLAQNKILAEAMHSEKSQAAREHILGRFHSGENKIVVATDLIARGIDVKGVSHIINYGLPQSPELYIHRIGRTARAGAHGVAITLCAPEDKALLDATARAIGKNIPISTSHPYITPNVTKILANGGSVKRGKRR